MTRDSVRHPTGLSKRARKRQNAALRKAGVILLPQDERHAVLTAEQQIRFAEQDRPFHAAIERCAESERRTREWIKMREQS